VKTIIEPFRIKSVEPLHYTTSAERERYLVEAGYNLFGIAAVHILIDPPPIRRGDETIPASLG